MNKPNRSASLRYRSAKTGQYVKPVYAKNHPSTTVKETVSKRKGTK